MQKKFYLDKEMGDTGVVIFTLCLLVCIGASLLLGRFLENVVVSTIFAFSILVFWISFRYGVYIKVDSLNIQVTRVFIPGTLAPVSEIISINKRPIFGGFFDEVYLRVRTEGGGHNEIGLINMPGLNKEKYKELFKEIHAINPNVEIDMSISDK